MKVKLIVIGKTKEKPIIEGIEGYKKKLAYFCKFELVEIPDVKKGKTFDTNTLQMQEAELIQKQVGDNDILVLLDEKGKQMTSRDFAGFIEQQQLTGAKHLVFAVGGAYGFPEELKARSLSISLSKMTFSHQLVRLIFMEQIYRAYAIINNFPYHND